MSEKKSSHLIAFWAVFLSCVVSFCAFSFFIFYLTSLTENQDVQIEKTHTVQNTEIEKTHTVQNTDAEILQVTAVAKSFWTAIHDKNITTARSNIYSPNRAQLGMLIEQDIEADNVPELPTVLEFDVEINGDTAIAVIRNSQGVGCDLIKADGRWWVYPGQE